MTCCVLALDIAMHRTGWALGRPEDGARPLWGVFETVGFDKHEGRELHRFRDWLEGLRQPGITPRGLTHLVIEQVFVDVRNPKRFQFTGTQAQLMLSGVALEWAHRSSIIGMDMEIDEWRKRFLGHCRKPKQKDSDKKLPTDYWKILALRRAAERGWYCEHHDEAEALGILDCALAALDKDYRHRTNTAASRAQFESDYKKGIHA